MSDTVERGLFHRALSSADPDFCSRGNGIDGDLVIDAEGSPVLDCLCEVTGTVTIDGAPCTGAHDDVVMVFQQYANRPDLTRNIAHMDDGEFGHKGHRLLGIPSRERLERVLKVLFDEREFLSPHGVRALSAAYQENPYVFRANGDDHVVTYTPGESDTGLFGGNSNWRGPVWFPVNYLLIESLERYHHFYGDSLKVECPAGSGKFINLREAAREIANRLATLFLPDARGQRPCHGGAARYASDPHWRDLVLFHEYFHGDTGRGVGATHQTGWTALAVRCIEKRAAARAEQGPPQVNGATAKAAGARREAPARGRG